jgi:hypothetical protein
VLEAEERNERWVFMFAGDGKYPFSVRGLSIIQPAWGRACPCVCTEPDRNRPSVSVPAMTVRGGVEVKNQDADTKHSVSFLCLYKHIS